MDYIFWMSDFYYREVTATGRAGETVQTWWAYHNNSNNIACPDPLLYTNCIFNRFSKVIYEAIMYLEYMYAQWKCSLVFVLAACRITEENLVYNNQGIVELSWYIRRVALSIGLYLTITSLRKNIGGYSIQ